MNFGGFPDPGEVPGDRQGVADEGDEPHPPLAGGTGQGVDAEGAGEEFSPRPVVGLALLPGLVVWLGAGRDARAPLTGCCQHTSVADGVVAWRRHARRQPGQQGERIEIDGDGAVGIRPLEDDADQAVGLWLELVLGDGRAQDVPEQRFSA